MSRSRGPYHKIYGLPPMRGTGDSRGSLTHLRSSEGGYTLVSLLALMTILALFAAAAVPSVRQQSLRERENEAIFRGEQVADAIRYYYIHRANTMNLRGDQGLPTSVDQLLEGIPVPGGSKKRQILRPSAARDPLSDSGEWRLVLPRSPELTEFQRSVMLYAGNVLPMPRDPQISDLQRLTAPPVVPVFDSGSSSSGTSASFDASGPFVGVSTRNTTNSVLYYYGIDRHDLWIFTPLFR